MATPTFDDIQDVLYTWANSVTGKPVVWADDAQLGEERTPYIKLRIQEIESPSNQNVTLSADGLTEHITNPSSFTLDVDVYGSGADQDSLRLIRSLYSADRYLDLWTILGYGNTTKPENLTFLETGARKPRYFFRILFYATIQEDFVSSYFDQTQISIDNTQREFTDIINGGEDPYPPCS
jgi:hypothetical protein